jgi:hypothetical protein
MRVSVLLADRLHSPYGGGGGEGGQKDDCCDLSQFLGSCWNPPLNYRAFQNYGHVFSNGEELQYLQCLVWRHSIAEQ